MIITAGCTQSIDREEYNPGAAYSLEVSTKHNDDAHQVSYPEKGSHVYLFVDQWLKDNPSGWRFNPGTLFDTENKKDQLSFALLTRDSSHNYAVIRYYDKESKFQQFIKELDENESKRIQSEIEKAPHP